MTNFEVPLIADEFLGYHIEAPTVLDVNGIIGADASGLDADFYQLPAQQGEQL